MSLTTKAASVVLFAVLIVQVLAGTNASAKNSKSKGSARPPADKTWVPSFRADVLPVLVQNCATAEGCHGAYGTHSVDLDLREATAYSQLVDAPSVVRKGTLLVSRGKPDQSFLIDKLVGALGPGEGKRMPLDDKTGMPIVPSPIPAEYVDKILKQWILANAPDN